MRPQLHHHIIDKLAVANGVVAGISLYPQVYQVFVQGIPNDLSPLTLWLILANNCVWIAYAYHRSIPSVGIAGVLNIIASLLLIL